MTTTITIRGAEIALAPGEHYAGLLLDDAGQPLHHLILLPGDAKGKTWRQAIDWAAQAGGALPSRREQALLFANAASHFEATWYWSSEQCSDAFAWGQYFDYGDQSDVDESAKARARAVRRFAA